MLKISLFALACVTVLPLPASALFAQSPAATASAKTTAASASATEPAASASTALPTFVAADVHPSPPRRDPGHTARPGVFRGDRYNTKDATLADLIVLNYNVDPDRVIGGPGWLAFDRFDVLAKVPAGASVEDAHLMMRTLLADRFKLVAHTDTRLLPAFVLSAGKTPKLKPAAAPTEPGGCQFMILSNTAGSPPNVKGSCHNTTMQSFVDLLHNVAGSYLTQPVVDATGLKGSYDFDLTWTYQNTQDSEVTLFTAVDKQLGLKLEAKDAPLPVVLVESASETPTPNIPDLDKILPPQPLAEFEVAVIHAANPDEHGFNIRIQGNTVTIQDATMEDLLRQVFHGRGIQTVDPEGAPSWLDDLHWDITGKASLDAAPTPIPGRPQNLDIDDANEMLHTFLTDRFKLVTHTDMHPTDTFALVAAGPKMKKGDPTNHPTCIRGISLDGKDPRQGNPLLDNLITCRNMTMARLALEFRIVAPDYVTVSDPVVIDATGLDGAFDFTLSYSTRSNATKTLASQSSNGDSSAASDPGLGGMSLYDAMQKQLGLKLEKRGKASVHAVFIDHIEEKPTAN